MAERHSFLRDSLIIAAHPDDELLWFGSILRQVDRVVMVFEDFWPDPSIGPARARALANFPRDGVESLRLAEAATYGCADWRRPVLTDFGLWLGREAIKRDLKQRALRLVGKSRAPRQGIEAHYRENFEAVRAALKPSLHAGSNVFTHNPWGEYGHEDHVRVFRALDSLRREIGFSLWMSNYATERSLPLALRYLSDEAVQPITLPVDKVFADQVAQVYRDAGCWTWADTWHWFDTEQFLPAPERPRDLATQGHLFPLNLFNIDPVT